VKKNKLKGRLGNEQATRGFGIKATGDPNRCKTISYRFADAAHGVDLLKVCAKRSIEIDPAVAAMVAYARDEILERANNDSTIGRIKYVPN
jgi:hypothetical protein